MRGWLFGTAMAVTLGLATVVSANQHTEKKKVSCDDVAAAMDEAGGSKSADMIAKQLGIPVEQVRTCMDKVDAPDKKKDAAH